MFCTRWLWAEIAARACARTAGLAILYPLYVLSFVSLIADFHMQLLYNSSFSKGLALAVTKQELELHKVQWKIL